MVENAIKYGIHETINEGTVSIVCSCTHNVLEVVVMNNYDQGGAPSVKTGIGIKNVENRLRLFYGSEDLLTIDKQNSTFTVKLLVPQLNPTS